MFDEHGATDPMAAVIAHSLISSVTVIGSVLQSLQSADGTLGEVQRRRLLAMAITQTEYLGEVLKDMARGLPAEAIDVLDAIDRRRPLPPD